jgi:spoIIIJ-associated protein
MPVIEFEGKTTEEAIEKACNQLHISSDELKFEIVTTGSSGIFGLGGKKARIRVTVEERIKPRKAEEAAKPAPERPEKREPRPRRETPKPYRPKPEKRDVKPHAPSGKSSDRDEDEESSSDSIPLPSTVPAPGEDVYDGPEDEFMTLGRKSLEGILNHMGVESTVEVKRIEDRIILSVDGDNSGLLIGKKGATLDALQFVVNKIVNKGRTEKYRVIVDIEDYRQRRHQSLIDLAHRMADKARRTKRPVTISQLSAHDRRVVHLALQEKHGLKTRSRGEGPLKNVVIIPGSRKGGHKSGGGPSSKGERPRPQRDADDPGATGIEAQTEGS